MIYNCLPVKGSAFVPNYRFLFLTVMLRIVIPAIIFIALAQLKPVLQPYLWLIIPYAIFAGILLYFEYAHHRLFVSEDFIIKKAASGTLSTKRWSLIKFKKLLLNNIFGIGKQISVI